MLTDSGSVATRSKAHGSSNRVRDLHGGGLCRRRGDRNRGNAIMTNGEAAYILKNAAFLSTTDEYKKIEEAVEMVVDALTSEKEDEGFIDYWEGWDDDK